MQLHTVQFFIFTSDQFSHRRNSGIFCFLCVLAHASLPNKVCNLLHYLTPLLYLEEISGEEGPMLVCHLLSKPKQHIGSHFLRIKSVLSAQK